MSGYDTTLHDTLQPPATRNGPSQDQNRGRGLPVYAAGVIWVLIALLLVPPILIALSASVAVRLLWRGVRWPAAVARRLLLGWQDGREASQIPAPVTQRAKRLDR